MLKQPLTNIEYLLWKVLNESTSNASKLEFFRRTRVTTQNCRNKWGKSTVNKINRSTANLTEDRQHPTDLTRTKRLKET